MALMIMKVKLGGKIEQQVHKKCIFSNQSLFSGFPENVFIGSFVDA